MNVIAATGRSAGPSTTGTCAKCKRDQVTTLLTLNSRSVPSLPASDRPQRVFLPQDRALQSALGTARAVGRQTSQRHLSKMASFASLVLMHPVRIKCIQTGPEKTLSPVGRRFVFAAHLWLPRRPMNQTLHVQVHLCLARGGRGLAQRS